MIAKHSKIFFVILIFLGIFSIIFVFPSPFNKGLNWLSDKTHLGLIRIPEKKFHLGLDIAGGTLLSYKADLSKIPAAERKKAMNGLRDVIERRVNLFGISEPRVQIAKEGKDEWRLIVELAGVKDINQAIEMIGSTPYLEFKTERSEKERNEILEAQKKGERLNEDPYFKRTKLDGRYLKKANVEIDQTTLEPKVTLEFNKEGAEIFKKLTSENLHKKIAIYLDGAPISIPVVQEVIPNGKAQITGKFTLKEAKQLAQRLNAGALPVPIKLISQYSVGASLGKDSLKKSIYAGSIGFLAIIVFMIIYYRKLGLMASLSLILYLVFALAIFKGMKVTLTLAGIAGFILSLGMAVDANILIFERFKEEKKGNLPKKAVIRQAFSRAWPSIRDGNLTTILVALILFYLTFSILKGFALTLSLGIILSIFTAMIATRVFLELFEK